MLINLLTPTVAMGTAMCQTELSRR